MHRLFEAQANLTHLTQSPVDDIHACVASIRSPRVRRDCSPDMASGVTREPGVCYVSGLSLAPHAVNIHSNQDGLAESQSRKNLPYDTGP